MQREWSERLKEENDKQKEIREQMEKAARQKEEELLFEQQRVRVVGLMFHVMVGLTLCLTSCLSPCLSSCLTRATDQAGVGG
jgi:hypothetical protein